MATSDSTSDVEKVGDQEAAIRRVLGYPTDGPIPVVGHYHNGRRYSRLLYSFCDDDAARRVHEWHNLIAKTWCRLLAAAGVSGDGADTVFRCPCVEAALRVYLVEQLSPATVDDGFTCPAEIETAAAGLDYRVTDGTHRWERAIQDVAGYSFPALALADASGLRIERGTLLDAPKKLVDHARFCRIPYPVNIVVRRAVEVGDVS